MDLKINQFSFLRNRSQSVVSCRTKCTCEFIAHICNISHLGSRHLAITVHEKINIGNMSSCVTSNKGWRHYHLSWCKLQIPLLPGNPGSHDHSLAHSHVLSRHLKQRCGSSSPCSVRLAEKNIGQKGGKKTAILSLVHWYNANNCTIRV